MRREWHTGDRVDIGDGKVYKLILAENGKAILAEILPDGRLCDGKYKPRRDRRLRKQSRESRKEPPEALAA